MTVAVVHHLVQTGISKNHCSRGSWPKAPSPPPTTAAMLLSCRSDDGSVDRLSDFPNGRRMNSCDEVWCEIREKVEIEGRCFVVTFKQQLSRYQQPQSGGGGAWQWSVIGRSHQSFPEYVRA